MKIPEKLLVPYEVVEVLFDLDAKDEDFNRVLIRSANETVETFLDRRLSVMFQLERLRAGNGVLMVREYPVLDVAFVMETASGKEIEPLALCADDEDNNRIMLPRECGNKLYEVSYLAGYDEVSVPAPIVEAITKLFVYKRNAFLDLQKGYSGEGKHAEMTGAIPADIAELIQPYARKRL